MIHFGVHTPRVYEVTVGHSDAGAVCTQCLTLLESVDLNGVCLVDANGCMLDAMASAVAEWPEKYKKRGQELLRKLNQGNRMVRMPVDFNDETRREVCVVTDATARSCDHDYLVIPGRCLCSDGGILCQSEGAIHLEDYGLAFSPRFREPTLVYGRCDKEKFQREVLAPVFREVKWVRFVDRLVGAKAKLDGLDCHLPENYMRGLDWVVGCLAKFANKERLSEVAIVSEYPSDPSEPSKLNSFGRRIVREAIESSMAALSEHSGVDVRLILADPGQLPHQRYLVTDQVALDIGRGYDLLDRKGNLRDVSVSLLSSRQLGNVTREHPLVGSGSAERVQKPGFVSPSRRTSVRAAT